jgi:hypothetical protein
MTTLRGVYENGQIRLLEQPPAFNTNKVLITFIEEENEEEMIRSSSLQSNNTSLEEYLEDEREDLYQEYIK